jgi:acyl-CoA carboxylase epsilon subunit
MADVTGDKAPMLRIVNGDATPEEVAAIVAVLSAVGGGSEAPAKRPAPAWAAPQRGVRRALPHGPGGWRASGLPR